MNNASGAPDGPSYGSMTVTSGSNVAWIRASRQQRRVYGMARLVLKLLKPLLVSGDWAFHLLPAVSWRTALRESGCSEVHNAMAELGWGADILLLDHNSGKQTYAN